MGSSTASGHYVCHIRKSPEGGMDKRDGRGRWYIFNDAKVALSEEPPLDMGYIYLYKRIDVPSE
jgi:ubiquitin carboxyl-terminal hydrolase 5/13